MEVFYRPGWESKIESRYNPFVERAFHEVKMPYVNKKHFIEMFSAVAIPSGYLLAFMSIQHYLGWLNGKESFWIGAKFLLMAEGLDRFRVMIENRAMKLWNTVKILEEYEGAIKEEVIVRLTRGPREVFLMDNKGEIEEELSPLFERIVEQVKNLSLKYYHEHRKSFGDI